VAGAEEFLCLGTSTGGSGCKILAPILKSDEVAARLVPTDSSMRSFLYRRLIVPVVVLLTQGITPEKIALSLAFGIVLGVFPVLGSTTILCAAAALIFGLNLPSIQLVNWLIYPLQLICLVPFIHLGELLFRTAPLGLSVTQILSMVHSEPRNAIATFWRVEVHAIMAWLLIGPIAIFLLYWWLSRVLRQVAASRGLRFGTRTKLSE
jgi:uncharacterized protein (DUF2062 family)